MIDLKPVVRLMLLCYDVRPHPDNPNKINFPEPGLYIIEFWYNDRGIARQPLLVE